jgi:mono/diheme cytochrome c family protein
VANGPASENLQELGQSNPDDWAQLWIDGTDPAVADLDRGGMPAFGEQLTPEEIDSIVEYLKTLQ